VFIDVGQTSGSEVSTKSPAKEMSMLSFDAGVCHLCVVKIVQSP
jgi:hypothetical protein